jgi:CubicO group peptidase (beta-lactamase class C family)
MKLYDQGLINLDDKLIKYVPEADNNGKDAITIKNLLLHNSGYDDEYPFNGNYNVDRVTIWNWTFTTALRYPTGT